MKLKKYFSGSFPRVRSKKKKHPPSESPDVIRGCDVSGDYIFSNSYTINRDSGCFINKTFELENNNLYYSRYDALDTINSNVKFDEIKPDNKCYSTKSERRDFGPLSWSCYSEGEPERSYSCNTIPKSRSRIRTNPWLPSPRLTPSSMESSMSSSISISSASYSPSSEKMSEGRNYGSISSDSAMDIDDVGTDPFTPSDSISLQNVSQTFDAKRISRDLKLSQLNKFNGRDIFFSDMDSPVSEGIENKQISDKGNYEQNFEGLLETGACTVMRDETVLSIQDLLAADDQLFCRGEITKTNKKAGPRETIYDDMPGDVFVSDSEADRHSADDNFKCQSRSKMSSKEALHDNSEDPDCEFMNMSADTGYDSLDVDRNKGYNSNASTPSSIYHEEGATCVDSLGTSTSGSAYQGIERGLSSCGTTQIGLSSFPDYKRSDINSNCDQDTVTCDHVIDSPPSEPEMPKRRLLDIKWSLAEKVKYLQEEKLIVEEKIRLAQEEDKIRRQEKIKFQKQMASQRKKLLLKTLQELHDKLESQSVRLQSSYNITLSMQRRISQKVLPVLFCPTTTIT